MNPQPWGYSGPQVDVHNVSALVATYYVAAAPDNEAVDFRSEDDRVNIRVDKPEAMLVPPTRWDKARTAYFRQASTRRKDTMHYAHPQSGQHAMIPIGSLPAALQSQAVWGITPRTVRVVPGAWDAGTER